MTSHILAPTFSEVDWNEKHSVKRNFKTSVQPEMSFKPPFGLLPLTKSTMPTLYILWQPIYNVGLASTGEAIILGLSYIGLCLIIIISTPCHNSIIILQ